MHNRLKQATSTIGMGRIIVTGGSGVVGRAIISESLETRHTILNIGLMPLENPAVHTLTADLVDSGPVFNALSSQWILHEPFPMASHLASTP